MWLTKRFKGVCCARERTTVRTQMDPWGRNNVLKGQKIHSHHVVHLGRFRVHPRRRFNEVQQLDVVLVHW
jgi:hypothetical protein